MLHEVKLLFLGPIIIYKIEKNRSIFHKVNLTTLKINSITIKTSRFKVKETLSGIFQMKLKLSNFNY